ncbi:MAG: tRNA (adenosine(37)-N6)-threonylcarbamoyltransferase complex dimerization subunit type 1 TsaB [Bacteroidota bacterium]|nr:tRNA (adenosine(37)-N6)-threonylcarbamoyltransferase complex dimerization subunit type 1 TsaB [Bacteroidota bacterium]
MPNILCIETSTTMCSVALCNENEVIAFKEANEGYTHAENLHVFIDEVLKQSGIAKKDINAIAVGKGPGSYTGLRIGVSAAKGMAYALNIPLISVNTLFNMALKVKQQFIQKEVLFCPMLDARRMEVYTATYGRVLQDVTPTRALVIDENSVSQFEKSKHYIFFGDGMPKCKELLSKIPNADFIENIFPSAITMNEYAILQYGNQKFENVAYFEPFYLKEFFTGK